MRQSALNAAQQFAPGADDAVRAAASTPNNKMLAGHADSPFFKALSAPLVPDSVSKIGSKIPIVGAGLTVLQTGIEVSEAEDKGDAALAVGKNVAGFAAGTVVTELMLASVAGGPATVAVVVGGVFIGWGVSEAIEYFGGE